LIDADYVGRDGQINDHLRGTTLRPSALIDSALAPNLEVLLQNDQLNRSPGEAWPSFV
jgi:hypothetical protein